MRSQRHTRYTQGMDSTGDSRYPGDDYVWDWASTWPSGSKSGQSGPGEPPVQDGLIGWYNAADCNNDGTNVIDWAPSFGSGPTLLPDNGGGDPVLYNDNGGDPYIIVADTAHASRRCSASVETQLKMASGWHPGRTAIPADRVGKTWCAAGRTCTRQLRIRRFHDDRTTKMRYDTVYSFLCKCC